MKKVLLSLLAVAALVLSCQNYDDEFAALNAKVATLEGQLGSLASIQSAVNSLQSAVSAIPGLAAELASIQAAIDAAATAADIEALQAELNSLIAANADALAAQGLDINAILGTVATYTGDITISNPAQLAFAKSLGQKVKSIKGTVSITLSSTNGLTAAGINEVTSMMLNVDGDISVTTNASIDLSNLTSVSGNYTVVGKDISDAALSTVSGNVFLNYDGGYSQPNLTSVGGIKVVDYNTSTTVTGTLAVDFSGLTSATSIGTSTNSSEVTFNAATTGYTAGTVEFTDATSIVIGDVPVNVVTAPDALTISLGYDGSKSAPLADLTVTAGKATSVTSSAVYIDSGSAALTGTTATALAAEADGDVSIDVAATGTVSFPNLIAAGEISADAASLSVPALVSLTGGTNSKGLELTAATSVSLPSLTNADAISVDKVTGTLTLETLKAVTGTLSADLVTSISAPNATVGTVDLEETGSSVSGSTVGATSLTLKSVTTITDLATITNVTLKGQAATFTFDNAATMKTLNFTGASNAVDLVIAQASGADTEALTTINVDGKVGTFSVTGGNSGGSAGADKVASITTSGTIQTVVIKDNDNLTTLTLNHTEDAANGASLTIDDNNSITGFTTKINRVLTFVVTDNVKLASFDASSMVSLPANTANTTAYRIVVSGNEAQITNGGNTLAGQSGLKGEYTALTATTAEAFVQSSLATVKPYALLVAAAATAATPTAVGFGGVTDDANYDAGETQIYFDFIYADSATTHATQVIGSASRTAQTTSAVIADLNALTAN